MNRRLSMLALASCLLAISGLAGCNSQTAVAEGQIWSYDNRAGEGASTLQILHIERETPIGEIYFVSVRALDAHRLGRWIHTTEIWPLVLTKDALSRSLRSYQWSEKVNRPYLKHLDSWWKDAREGHALDRTFNVPLKDALDQLQKGSPDAEKRRPLEA